MEANVFIGHYCPNCRSTVGLTAGIGGPLTCPGCGGPMRAASGGPEMQVLANVTCKNCGSIFGIITSVGGRANCPVCKSRLA